MWTFCMYEYKDENICIMYVWDWCGDLTKPCEANTTIVMQYSSVYFVNQIVG